MNARVPLQAMLADPATAGVYFVDRRERPEYEAAAGLLDFGAAVIDFDGCEGRDEALCRFARALRFPEWFGHNWDALADCLADLSWMPADGYLLLLANTEAWQLADRESFDVAIEVLGDRELFVIPEDAVIAAARTHHAL